MFISMLFTRDDDYDNMIGSYVCLQFGKYNHLIGGDYMMQVIGETSDIRLFIWEKWWQYVTPTLDLHVCMRTGKNIGFFSILDVFFIKQHSKV